jgi:hypothetical protein
MKVYILVKNTWEVEDVVAHVFLHEKDAKDMIKSGLESTYTIQEHEVIE